LLLTATAVWWVPSAPGDASPIRFSFRPIAFTLENSETSRRYAPETMAGGLALFDYDGDGDLDIYFANGADIRSLKKTSPKYWNRLFANDGAGNFTDVTEKAGVAGAGYDMGVAVADYDNDGDLDMFVAGVHIYTLHRCHREGGTQGARPRVRSAVGRGRGLAGCRQGWLAGFVRCQLFELEP
jgi:hypothetical protein